MKIKIDINGFLEIERAKKFKAQFCPFADRNQSYPNERELCGDWCPLFSEVSIFDAGLLFGLNNEAKPDYRCSLKLCHKTYEIPTGNFIDERIPQSGRTAKD